MTLPTRVLTGEQIMSRKGKSREAPVASSSPSHCGHSSRLSTTGIRLCSYAHNSFGVVVTIVKLRMRSPAGERQVLHLGKLRWSAIAVCCQFR